MSQDLLFDFRVDKPSKTVFIEREFAAELSLVWDAFTKAELLDQWVAPKPWSSRTRHMDFRVGGRRFYAMVSPEGQERWSLQRYTAITPKTHFELYNSFADENEQPDLPGSEWSYLFSEKEGITTVRITIFNESLERLERMVEMGFVQGFTMSVGNLEELLQTLRKS